MDITLRSVGLFGIFLFGILFSVIFASPKVIEASAKGFVELQIEKEVRGMHEAANQSATASKVLDIVERLGLERKKYRKTLAIIYQKKLPV